MKPSLLVALGGVGILTLVLAVRYQAGPIERPGGIAAPSRTSSAERPSVSTDEERETLPREEGHLEPVERPAPKAAPAPRVPRWSLLDRRQEEILFVFDGELRLSKDQRTHFADSFLRRQDRIEAYHVEIRKSGVFNIPRYRLRIRQMIAESYDEMARVLDPGQQQRFDTLVARGQLGDAVEFEMDPDLVVVK